MTLAMSTTIKMEEATQTAVEELGFKSKTEGGHTTLSTG